MIARPLHDASGSITEGGTSQVALVASDSRLYLLIQNISNETLWVNFDADATEDQPSVQIVAGAVLTFEGGYVPSSAVSVIAATTGKKFVIKHA